MTENKAVEIRDSDDRIRGIMRMPSESVSGSSLRVEIVIYDPSHDGSQPPPPEAGSRFYADVGAEFFNR